MNEPRVEQVRELMRRTKLLVLLENFAEELHVQLEQDTDQLERPASPVAIQQLTPPEPIDEQLKKARADHALERAEWVRHTALTREEIRNLTAILFRHGIKYEALNPGLMQECAIRLGLEAEELDAALHRLTAAN